MKPFLQRLRPILVPRNSQREKFARLILGKIPSLRSILAGSYRTWIKQNEPDKNTLEEQKFKALSLLYQPLISIVVPVFSPPLKVLHEMILSVQGQSYQNWELCLVNGDLLNTANIQKVLEAYAAQDKRIKVKALDTNYGIAGNTNVAIEMAQGDFIGFLDHDDCLAPFALYAVVEALNQYPETDLFYSDEDYITPDGKRRYNPSFKPIFSIDYLRAANYMPHFFVLRKELGNRLKWLRQGFDGAQDYDLALRVVEQARWITHIPQVLYHWRALSTSTASAPEAKSYASVAGISAVREHLTRCGLQGDVEHGAYPTLYHVKYQLNESPLVSIIIPNYEHAEDLHRCVDSILEHTTYQCYEILIVENNSQKPKTFAMYRHLQEQDKRVRVVEYHQQPFNYSAINNYAVSLALGSMLLFLNNDTQVLNPDWLERMLEYAMRPDVGVVGAKLYYPDMRIQHAGVTVGLGGAAGHYFGSYPKAHPGYRYNLLIPQNLSAVTAACLMMRRSVFDEIGGFDEAYQLAFGDIDLCLKVRQNYYLIVWTPFAELIHHESKTRGYDNTPEKGERFNQEVRFFLEKWAAFLAMGDPYYNPNLTLHRGDFSVRAGICQHVPRTSRGLLTAKSPFIPNRS
jgi:GT2 family glycosyltransferase